MMKKPLFAALFVTLALPLSGAFAQSDDKAPPAKMADSKTLDGNYVLTLVTSGKDQPAKELSVVLATPNFNTSSPDPVINFVGTCNPQGDDTYLITYSLGRTIVVPFGPNNFANHAASTTASVQMHLGESIEIIKDGDQTFTLKLDHYKAPVH